MSGKRSQLVFDDGTSAPKPRKKGHNIQLSKALSYILRHGAAKEGLQMSADHSEAPTVVHGTYHKCWESIKTQGLSRMSRNHIHFAPGEPGEEGVISGLRSSCEILVFINLEKALKDGFTFYRSSNNVILCPGNELGVLPPEYFERVVQTKPKKQVLFPTS